MRWVDRFAVVAAVLLITPGVARGGAILREVWNDIPGNTINNLRNDPRFPNQPSFSGPVTNLFEAPVDFADNYGQRMHGYIVPPVTGTYTFWIASDDNGELWLSTNEDPVTQRRIANVAGWTSSREWTKESNQKSGLIFLEANRPYYIAALQKEGSGGDNLAVRWLRPDGIDDDPIPAAYLLPWGTVFAAPRIVRHPQPAAAVEGQLATFSVELDPSTPATIQWQRNQVDVPGANRLTLEYGPVTFADHNARFHAVLTNNLGSATSADAALTVMPDTVRPAIESALNQGIATVRVTFSEPIEPPSGTNIANYRMSGGVRITGAAFGKDSRTILLSTTAVAPGTVYTVTVNSVRDLAAVPNAILPDSQYTFTAVEYTPIDIGGPAGGMAVPVPGGFDVTGTGADIGGRADQFHFGYQERTGDFDVRVRVDGLSITDPYVQAGLVARENLDPNARFAGVFASSPQLGCFFESRATAGAVSQIAAPPGGFPANYPHTWLRLRRSGSVFTGYAGFDGQTWQQLGSVTLAGPSEMFFGFAVASHNTNSAATVRFRDFGPVINPAGFTHVARREPLGPANRRTGLIFSEIMYHPPDRSDSQDLEFVEVYNAESIFVDLSGWRLSGAVEYVFPEKFKLQAGEFAVIAADPAALESVYGLEGVLGPYQGRLDNAGETLRLLNPAGAVRLEVGYSPDSPWPVAADGAGHSLVLARPSFGEDAPRAWASSERIGGSPGGLDALTANPWAGVVIKEFLAHTDDPQLDFIELYNAGNAAADLSGCFLTDDPATNRFRIPDGTLLAPRGFVSFDQTQLGFALDSTGETMYLINADQTRVLDVLRFGAQENGVSSGRAPDGSPFVRRLTAPTPGNTNAPWRVEEIVINEIMYHPISEEDADQYVELHNRSTAPLDMSGWRFVAGIDYTFPAGALVPAGGFVVVAKDAARLRGNYTQLTAVNTFGNFSGQLSNSGERLALGKPDLVVTTNTFGIVRTNTVYIVISEVTYADGGRWPGLADGGGSSLELIDPRADPLRPPNWAASDETQKGRWTSAEVTAQLNLGETGRAANRLQVLMLGPGEALVDDLEIFRVGSTNLLQNGGFESASNVAINTWTFFGNHSQSSIDTTGAFSGQKVLHIRAQGDGDTANNTIRANLTSSLSSGQTVTIRAQARWLTGWPELLVRVRGNWIELPVRMEIPVNLGTPGAPNSRRVANAGPAIFDVSHAPALPRASEPVVVTCRVSDPDGAAAPRLLFRVDSSATLTPVVMRDDGAGGDSLAGDGVFSGALAGRPAGNLVAFRLEAADQATPPASSLFPDDAPARECLVRWGDTIPFGTFGHYHMWSTAATESARNRSRALDNTFRDCTLVYGNFRVIYNAGFRDKGSPYHGGSGDFAVTVSRDDLLLGTDDRVFGSTGNGGSENTGLRGDVSAWIGAQMGIPYLHSHYMRLYRNGSQFREILYDLEQPSRDYARSWFGGGDLNDHLFKIAVWFEFDDNNSGFGANGATIQPFLSAGQYKLARYRWNWQPRAGGNTVNDYSSVFSIVAAANNTSDRVTRLLDLADMEQWMRVFAFNRVLGNWDAWTFNVGQNMFLYAPLGRRALLMPWDIDFVLGLGNGVTDALWGGQDPVVNQLNGLPVYRRMLWRAFQDAVSGPMRPENYGPQIDARRAVLLKNNVTGLTVPTPAKTYLEGRRNHIQRQLQTADTPFFNITSNNGDDFTTANPVATLTGTAPFAVANIEINGVPHPVTWTEFTTWRIDVPLGGATNDLELVGRDLRDNTVPGATDRVRIGYTGAVPQPQDWVVINEIMYDAPQPDAEFLELHNRHPGFTFDLSGYRLNGLGFTIPAGTFLPPNGYLVLVEDRAGFAGAYGSSIPVAGQFDGRLDRDGEMLQLIRPGTTPAGDILIDDVRYENIAPWPLAANGLGPSLQLIDPAQDNWRAGNWAVTPTNDLGRATPGRANATRALLEPFPPLWINEVLPQNQAGPADNQGDRGEPWIELFNSGSTPLDLSAYFLTDDLNALFKWPFPPGTILSAGQYLLVWADGEPNESAPAALHTSFRLNPTNGTVALSRIQSGAPAVMDYLRYDVSSPDRAFGSIPDGEPRRRRLIYFPTPGIRNNPAIPTVPVVINEWMASNASTLADPADADFDDWFELYNTGSTPVDLSGYFLTDNLTNWNQYAIPSGTIIPAGGFRLFWADGATNQNAAGRDLHTNFRLAAGGEQLGLFAPDGTPVDGVTFGAQTDDISQGRYPDAAEPPFPFFAIPTPGRPNVGQFANQVPVLEPISNRSIAEGQPLAFRIAASDPDTPAQTLTFSLTESPAGASIHPVTGDFSWTPAEADGPGVFSIAVRVTDSGSPPRSVSRTFTVNVLEVNQPPSLEPVTNVTLEEGALFILRVRATDPDIPGQRLTFSLGAGAPAGLALDPLTGELSWTPAEDQGPGTYSITVQVTDDGSPPLSAARAFTATVLEINNPPVIAQVPPQSVDEGTLLQLQIDARDPDAANAKLTYTLENPPPGAAIDLNTGLFAWTPGETEGPRDYNVTVRVSEPGGSPDATMSFLVGVREVNTAPVLAPIPEFAARPGDRLTFTNQASDADLPPQTLSFAAAGLPPGATLDPVTGLFDWAVGDDPPAGIITVTVTVTDDNVPPSTTERTFRIFVNAPIRIVINEIMHRPDRAGAEYVELFNPSAANAVELSGWRLEGYDFVFPIGIVLEPGGYICVAGNLAAFRSAYGNAPAVVGEARITLPASGGLVRLWSSAAGGGGGQLIDEVFFELRAPWPPAAATTGSSLQLIDAAQDNRRPSHWGASTGSRTNPPVEIIPMTATWKYWQSATFPGNTWTDPSFNDDAWPAGDALLYVEASALPAPKNTPLTLGRTTYYFRSRFNFTGNPDGAQIRLRTVIDDGAVFYLNGQRIHSLAMPESFSQSTFATRTVGNAALEGPFVVPATGLRPGDNVLAVEVHQVNATSSDIVFGAAVELETVSAAGFTPGAPNSIAADLPPLPDIWINEVLPANATGLLDNAAEREPWIELFNAEATVVDLTAFFLSDDLNDLGQWPFPAGTIPARGFFVAWADGEPAESVIGQPHTNFRLRPDNGSVFLAWQQPAGLVLVDYLHYSAPGADRSYGLAADGQPATRTVLPTPSPGLANQIPGPGQSIALGAILQTDGRVQLQWNTRPGARYRLQSASTLATPSWQTIFETVAGDSTLSFADPAPLIEPQRYYRVLGD